MKAKLLITKFKTVLQCKFKPSSFCIRECISKIWSFSSACKILGVKHPLGADIWSSKKVNLGRYDSTSKHPMLVDLSSPDFFA